MKEMLMIIMAAVLANNYVLVRFLGICPFLGVSKKLDSAVGMSFAVIFVMVLATAATWPIQRLLLDPNGIGYMQTTVFILVIAALVQLIETFMKKDLNLSDTARQMYIHRNTLVYRLEKIKKITGLDLREFDHAIVFKVAMMVKQYLDSLNNTRY